MCLWPSDRHLMQEGNRKLSLISKVRQCLCVQRRDRFMRNILSFYTVYTYYVWL